MSDVQAPIEVRGQILVVDDNQPNRNRLVHALERLGQTAHTAASGREALQKLRQTSYDILLLDLVLPDMDGFELLEEIRNDVALRNMVVLIVSATNELDSIVRSISLGAEGYIFKPVNSVMLRARIETSLEKKRLRDLERAYFQQEMILRQSEKLATLGKLSAGVAHELNNPAAAAQRSASQLLVALERMHRAGFDLAADGLTAAQRGALDTLVQRAAERIERPLTLDSLTRNDLQDELEQWLEEQGVEEAWDFAADLVALGYTSDNAAMLADVLGPERLDTVVTWLSATFTLGSLAAEISHATGRISETVKALKSYSYMDQAPAQQVDIHDGLENTLTILRHNLKDGITIERDYADDLPRIDAFGSELNQVWTNLIDNAIAAMEGVGRLTLRSRQDGEWVVVNVEDTGHGIPPAVQSKIFDPFFTTKPPGEGTGLGLNISYNIVVQRHRGQFSVRSEPGATCFEVRLPIRQSAAPATGA